MSSLELSIGGHEELAPLSVVLVDHSADNSEQEMGGDDPNNNGGGRRKSRRLRHVGHPSEPPRKASKYLELALTRPIFFQENDVAKWLTIASFMMPCLMN